jgi:hypothetical protein
MFVFDYSQYRHLGGFSSCVKIPPQAKKGDTLMIEIIVSVVSILAERSCQSKHKEIGKEVWNIYRETPYLVCGKTRLDYRLDS